MARAPPWGDPIEIGGLKAGFQGSEEPGREHLKGQPHCGIGSVKTQIGHLEGAAGIAGTIKVLLAMEANRIPGNLHFEKLNPYIDLKGSPFYVVDKTRDWCALEDPQGKPIPRRAGVSSFGFGGTNAHIVLEQAHTPVSDDIHQGPQVIVLSAKKPDRLKAYAQNLLAFLEARLQDPHLITRQGFNLADMAYTLQLGREPMNERLAFVAGNLQEAVQKLKDYLSGEKAIEDFYSGNAKTEKALSGLLAGEEEGFAFLRQLTENRKLGPMARVWVSGVELDWSLLHQGRQPRRLSLPTYPFARDRHWFEETSDQLFGNQPKTTTQASLHPLIDTNESTLTEQCFRKRFTGKEFILRDHVVSSVSVLPAVATMEMAREAGSLSNFPHRVSKLRDLVWPRSLAVSKNPTDIFISLYPMDREVSYEIGSIQEDGDRVVTSTGQIVYETESSQIATPEYLDIPGILARCHQENTPEPFYQNYRDHGYNYGIGFRGIRMLRFNDREALSRIEIAPELRHTATDFGLHPTLMDSALQTVMGLTASTMGQSATPYMPFAIGEVAIAGTLPEVCYAYAQPAGEQGSVKKFNISIADENGQIRVFIRDYSLRAVKAKDQPVEAWETLYYGPVWLNTPVRAGVTLATGLAAKANGHTLILDHNADFFNRLRKQAGKTHLTLLKPGKAFRHCGDGVYEINPANGADYQQLVDRFQKGVGLPGCILHLWNENSYTHEKDQLAEQLNLGVYATVRLTRALMRAKVKNQIALLVFHRATASAPQPQFSAMSGVLKTIRKENPKFIARTIELEMDPHSSREQFHQRLLEVLPRELDSETSPCEILIRKDSRWSKVLREFKPGSQPSSSKITIKHDGVYLITGGAGELGLMFADYLARQGPVKLVLCGRSKLNETKTARLQALRDQGAQVLYVRGDVAEAADAKKVVDEARNSFGPLTGVIHAAGMLRDGFIIKKRMAEMAPVIAPKVFGTRNLDEATRGGKTGLFLPFLFPVGPRR